MKPVKSMTATVGTSVFWADAPGTANVTAARTETKKVVWLRKRTS
jgi:hypothetical protein